MFCFTFITFNCFSGEIIGCQHDGSTRAFPVNIGNGNRNRCTTVRTIDFPTNPSIIHNQVLSTWTYEINICVFHLSLHGLRMEMMQQCPPSRRYFNADILTRQARKHGKQKLFTQYLRDFLDNSTMPQCPSDDRTCFMSFENIRMPYDRSGRMWL